jgi:1-acyl-sn-glycerol-3-phosphate acyltransferase
MIKATHSKWAHLLFWFYTKRILKKNFSSLLQSGSIPELSEERPLLLLPNHISWWDGFFIYWLYKKFFAKRKIYLMMLEKELKRYWFFRHVGAFSIAPEQKMTLAATFHYLQKLSQKIDSFMVIYAQGKIQPHELLDLAPGITHFLKKDQGNSSVLPVIFRIQHFNQKKPALIFRIGQPLANPQNLTVTELEAILKEEKASLDQDLFANNLTVCHWT